MIAQPINRLIFLFHRFFVAHAVENKVQHNGGQTAKGDTAMKNNGRPAWEVMIEVRFGQGYHTHTDTYGYEHQVIVAIEVYFGKCTNTAGNNHAEHGNAGTAQHGVRNARNNGRHLRH